MICIKTIINIKGGVKMKISKKFLLLFVIFLLLITTIPNIAAEYNDSAIENTTQEFRPRMAKPCSTYEYVYYDNTNFVKTAIQTVYYSNGTTETFITNFEMGEFSRPRN